MKNELDKELVSAYADGFRIGYLALPPVNPYPILSDPHSQWTLGRKDGEESRRIRIESATTSTPTTKENP